MHSFHKDQFMALTLLRPGQVRAALRWQLVGEASSGHPSRLGWVPQLLPGLGQTGLGPDSHDLPKPSPWKLLFPWPHLLDNWHLSFDTVKACKSIRKTIPWIYTPTTPLRNKTSHWYMKPCITSLSVNILNYVELDTFFLFYLKKQ